RQAWPDMLWRVGRRGRRLSSEGAKTRSQFVPDLIHSEGCQSGDDQFQHDAIDAHETDIVVAHGSEGGNADDCGYCLAVFFHWQSTPMKGIWHSSPAIHARMPVIAARIARTRPLVAVGEVSGFRGCDGAGDGF